MKYSELRLGLLLLVCLFPVFRPEYLLVYIDDPIDLVYLWVNGSDPIWAKKMQSYAPQTISQNYISERYIEKNELMLTLRSVELYLPWVRKIHIITDDQYPYWINLSNPILNFVSHRTILGNNASIFNSNSIQYAINKIPNLANKFIVADDDTFWSKSISKSYYFNGRRPIIHIDSHYADITKIFGFKNSCNDSNNEQVYFHSLFKSLATVQQKFPEFKTPNFNSAHVPFPYTRELMEQALMAFPHVKKQTKLQFRNCKMIQFQNFLSYYAFALKAADSRTGDSYFVYNMRTCVDVYKKLFTGKLNQTAICLNGCDNAHVNRMLNHFPKSKFEKD